MRNPEQIDLDEYPPPPGYTVASEEDMDGVTHAPKEWMFWNYGEWMSCCGELTAESGWTYLRPNADGKPNPDHQFPG